VSAAPTMLRAGSGIGHSEHISLESDSSETRAKPDLGKTLVSFELRDRARGIATEIAILADHYLACSTRRLRLPEQGHNVDLQFIDPQPVVFRYIAWRWLYAALALSVLTAASILVEVYLRHSLIDRYSLPSSIVLGTATLCSYLMCYYFTTETLFFVSLHGRVPVAGISGGLGTLRHARPCAAEIVKRIKLARRYFKLSKGSHLRDEMREHTRLFGQGALSDKQYAEAKLRILKAHD